MMNAVRFLALFLPWPFLLCGCLLTADAWQRPLKKEMRERAPLWIVQSNSVPGVTNRFLIVGYTVPGGNLNVFPSLSREKQFRLALPLDNDEHAAYPFGYAGQERQSEKILADLPAAQLTAIRNHRFSGLEPYRNAPASPECIRLFTRGETRQGIYAALYRHQTEFEQIDGIPMGKSIFSENLPVRVILIPPTQPRPAGDKAADVARAILATPFLLAADVVFTPAFVLGMVFIGGAKAPPPPAHKVKQPPATNQVQIFQGSFQ